MMLRRLAVILSVLCLPAFLQAQQGETPAIAIPVAGPVSMIQGDGGNIGVVADPDGLLMIDAMYERSADPVRAAIKSLPGGDRIRILVNTHWHGDHTDGNKIFGPGAVVISHENVRPLLTNPQMLMGRQTSVLPSSALPNVTYSDSLTVYAGGEPIRLVHYPNAHTDGDTVVFLDRVKVIHMGDMFFNGLFPFLDVTHGGDIDNWVRHLDSIISELPADVKIIPGHGPLAGIAELKAFRQMLFDSAETVRSQMKDGRTLEQIQTPGLPDRFAPWTKGFLTTAQWLELVYRSLEKR